MVNFRKRILQTRDPQLVSLLRMAALTAIATYGDFPERPDRIDPNPYTSSLTAYDLARLFVNAPGDRDNIVESLDGIMTIVKRTSGSDRAAARALWMAHELKRLGADTEAQRFARLTESAMTE